MNKAYIRRFARNLLLLPLIMLVACGPTPSSTTSIDAEVPATYTRNGASSFSTLTVAFCADPASWFLNGKGDFVGFEYDLLKSFSEEVQMTLKPTASVNIDDLFRKLKSAQTSVSAGLYRPMSIDENDKIIWTDPYYSVETLVVYNTNLRRPKNWEQITGDTVAYLKNPGMESLVAELAKEYPGIRWKPVSAPSSDALLAQVDNGTYPYALVTAHRADLARNIYFSFATAFTTGYEVEMAWALPDNKTYLRNVLNEYIARSKENGLIDSLVDRYFNHPQQVDRNDAGIFQTRIREDLPEFKDIFKSAQEMTGVEWRLLAAIAYQESRWDPLARSETGVRGFMQITLDTARHLGLDEADRFDAERSVHAAAVYLQMIKDRLPEEIVEPDRTWVTLAAYNIGLGHIEDAQRLARKKGLSPYLWKDIRKMLPLLARAEYYQSARHGYARGGMPVAFVDRVRAYYDILLRHEPHHEHLQLHVKNTEASKV
ncbi:MAG: membrane-bound lytic murein transglycosylase MltF [Burkholderiales bacterium]|nr:membrane-bound lytic murein transglycosylase MltF [Burkholderiales bacterium]